MYIHSFIHSFIHSYIQGLCHSYSCYEKVKIKTTDKQGNPISYHSRCQEHHDQMLADNKARYHRRKQEKGEGK